jgi:hypothetical protein
MLFHDVLGWNVWRVRLLGRAAALPCEGTRGGTACCALTMAMQIDGGSFESQYREWAVVGTSTAHCVSFQ